VLYGSWDDGPGLDPVKALPPGTVAWAHFELPASHGMNLELVVCN